jgi:predicted alpha/beta-hydrolase family hydrolase
MSATRRVQQAPTSGTGSMLLFPGAGSDRTHSCLVAIDAAVTAAVPGTTVVRADFPYRRASRRAPDRAPVLLQAIRDEVAALGDGPLVLGGRSMGGRMCSMAVADGVPAAGLVLVSYPLHPPGKPDRLRVEHLPALRVPCLFVHGTKDAFGTPEELSEWTASIPGPVDHVWIDGGTHDLKRADARVAAAVVEWLAARSVLSPGRRPRRPRG